jgi:hypothetical protein
VVGWGRGDERRKKLSLKRVFAGIPQGVEMKEEGEELNNDGEQPYI